MPATSSSLPRLAVALVATPLARAYWDGSRDAPDPYTQAMMASRRAQFEPDALRKDPVLFKRMFGQLAVEQNQAKFMDEHQTTSAEQQCEACHGVVVEFERMMVERKSEATGGLGGRDQLAVWRTTAHTVPDRPLPSCPVLTGRSALGVPQVADAYEKICHLNRYEYHDPVNPTKRSEHSRHYFGLAPVIFANACKRVVDEWSDHDEIEQALIAGGAKNEMHRELREAICNNDEYGHCRNMQAKVEVRAPTAEQKKANMGDTLWWKGKQDSCEAEGKKKKKKKKKVDPISGKEL